MWARIVEFMLAMWLLLSPFIFRGEPRHSLTAVSMGGIVGLFSLLSFWRPLRHSHLLTGIAAVVMILLAYFAGPRPGPAAAQNQIVIGLLLAMLSIVPNEATLPPEPWRGKQQP